MTVIKIASICPCWLLTGGNEEKSSIWWALNLVEKLKKTQTKHFREAPGSEDNLTQWLSCVITKCGDTHTHTQAAVQLLSLITFWKSVKAARLNHFVILSPRSDAGLNQRFLVCMLHDTDFHFVICFHKLCVCVCLFHYPPVLKPEVAL